MKNAPCQNREELFFPLLREKQPGEKTVSQRREGEKKLPERRRIKIY